MSDTNLSPEEARTLRFEIEEFNTDYARVLDALDVDLTREQVLGWTPTVDVSLAVALSSPRGTGSEVLWRQRDTNEKA